MNEIPKKELRRRKHQTEGQIKALKFVENVVGNKIQREFDALDEITLKLMNDK
tara:strand:- start:2219 stop:2377 length:159 start_codon:yes stop_codon:yes gene_type:complete